MNQFSHFTCSIDSMAKLARLTVEKESKIQDAIVLEDKELIIDCVGLPILMMCPVVILSDSCQSHVILSDWRRSFANGFE